MNTPGRTCSSCGAAIVWLKTATGANMPTDAATVRPDDVTFNPPRHTSHFATCPHAASHRRRRKVLAQ